MMREIQQGKKARQGKAARGSHILTRPDHMGPCEDSAFPSELKRNWEPVALNQDLEQTRVVDSEPEDLSLQCGFMSL
jgi:hypothetical protein